MTSSTQIFMLPYDCSHDAQAPASRGPKTSASPKLGNQRVVQKPCERPQNIPKASPPNHRGTAVFNQQFVFFSQFTCVFNRKESSCGLPTIQLHHITSHRIHHRHQHHHHHHHQQQQHHHHHQQQHHHHHHHHDVLDSIQIWAVCFAATKYKPSQGTL